jgi:putative transposase
MMLNSLLIGLRGQAAMQAEIIALRHQLTVFQRTQKPKRIMFKGIDRCLWVWLSRLWSGWRSTLIMVKPETVIGWHHQGFRWYWTWKVRHGRSGRPRVPKETRDLIRIMSRENPLWGAPRIHGELLKLGIKISEATVAKYMVRHQKPPSQTWKTFLHNHVSQLASIDFFTVHTIWFEILFVFIVLAHDRRRVVHFNVTAHPTAEWTAQQIVEAFPFDTAPKYLLRDRDRIYGFEFRKQVEVMGIKEVLGATRSSRQRAHVERVIGSIRRECLDHVIVFDEEALRHTLRSYLRYYQASRLIKHIGNRQAWNDRPCVWQGRPRSIAAWRFLTGPGREFRGRPGSSSRQCFFQLRPYGYWRVSGFLNDRLRRTRLRRCWRSCRLAGSSLRILSGQSSSLSLRPSLRCMCCPYSRPDLRGVGTAAGIRSPHFNFGMMQSWR